MITLIPLECGGAIPLGPTPVVTVIVTGWTIALPLMLENMLLWSEGGFFLYRRFAIVYYTLGAVDYRAIEPWVLRTETELAFLFSPLLRGFG